MAQESPGLHEFVVTCVVADECFVFIEPWGTEYLLKSDDWLTIKLDTLALKGLEVTYSPGAILIGLSREPVKMTNKAGQIIPL